MRWLNLQNNDLLYALVKRIKDISTKGYLFAWRQEFRISDRCLLPKKLSGLTKSAYVDMLSACVQEIGCCLNTNGGLHDDQIVINFFVKLSDLSNDEYDQLRVKNGEEIARKMDGTTSREKLWAEGMDHQAAFWKEF